MTDLFPILLTATLAFVAGWCSARMEYAKQNDAIIERLDQMIGAICNGATVADVGELRAELVKMIGVE